ncbi:hypothetical protein C8Q78DRAFT_1063539 [Trametes maxima]|nr:hypothetical protein C8Q78DRAFT_1063539 [Trametes maxima]
MPSDLITVDNLDFNQITYSTSPDENLDWIPYQPPNDPDVWNALVERAAAPGLSATFSFTGSQVSVVGRVEPAKNGALPPLSLYSVGSTHLQAYIADNVSAPVDGVAFFNSSVMPYGAYTLVINVSRASMDAPFFLDYIRYNTTDPAAAPGTSTATATGASGSSSTSEATPTGGVVEQAKASHSGTPVGPIVGGVVGGVVVLAAALFALLYFRARRRHGRAPISPLSPSTPTAARITPFLAPGPSRPHSAFGDTAGAGTGSAYTDADGEGAQGMREVGGYAYASEKGQGQGQHASKAAMARTYVRPESPYSSVAEDVYAGSRSGSRTGSVTGTGTGYGHSPMSSVHDLPNFAPAARGLGVGNGKGGREETRALLGSGHRRGESGAGGVLGQGGMRAAGSGLGGAQEDSGVRFEPGVTPSDVAPALVVAPGTGAMPVRNAGTRSEVARADVPPAYTPD